MTDYWKSQEKKYCDFCKCWIADNKASRDFHENGNRHKENVKKRLRNITKASAKAQKETEKFDATIRKMEAAAMEAYKRDVELNADLTSVAINKKLQEENLAIASGSSQKLWKEAVTKDGKSYYWNTATNETSWQKPTEGYYSLKEQREDRDKSTANQLKTLDKYRQQEARVTAAAQAKEDEEERAKREREKLKARRVKEDTPPPVYGPIIDPGKNDPYGKWQKVEAVQSAPLDLQLPVQQEYFECPVVVQPEPVVKEFKEKTVEHLDDSAGETSFKKRKFNAAAKRNTRQRLDVD